MQKETVEAQPSASAQNVAVCRAVAAHEANEAIRGHDTLAELFLTDEGRKSLQNPVMLAAIKQKLHSVSPGGYEYFIARTAYMDSVVEHALRDNIPQIVYLGAGYDTRTFRFVSLFQDTRIFELDTRATQQRKRAVLEQAGIPMPVQLTFLTVDFNHDDLAGMLAQAGYSRARRTLFIWEGVSYYLPPETVEATLDFVRRNAPSGSMLCFDYMLAAGELENRFGAKQSRAAMQAMYTAEPLQFDLESGRVEAFLAEHGYTLIEHLTAPDLEARYLTLGDGSLAGHVLDLFGIVLASVQG